MASRMLCRSPSTKAILIGPVECAGTQPTGARLASLNDRTIRLLPWRLWPQQARAEGNRGLSPNYVADFHSRLRTQYISNLQTHIDFNHSDHPVRRPVFINLPVRFRSSICHQIPSQSSSNHLVPPLCLSDVQQLHPPQTSRYLSWNNFRGLRCPDLVSDAPAT
jgi:hypothetical protein